MTELRGVTIHMNDFFDEVLNVEVLVDATGKLWVNVDGQCVLRIRRARNVIATTKTSVAEIFTLSSNNETV